MVHNRTFSVYKHTNKANGKVYIGMTSLTPSARFGKNGCQYSMHGEFYKDICKYGWDNGFDHDILADGLSESDACKMESELIAKYNSTDPSNGYNIAKGVSRAHYGYELNIDNAERERRRKFVQSDYVRRENSMSKLGERNPMYGKTYGEHPGARRVRCIETDTIYSCAKEAGEAVGAGHTHIIAVCRGKRKTSGGYHWEYVVSQPNL